MTYLIIAVVLLYLIGTITWVMPSRRDKKLAGMRSRARDLGFQLQYKNEELNRELNRGHGAVAYMRYLRLRPTPLDDAEALRLIRLPEVDSPVTGWRIDSLYEEMMVPALNEILSQLPKDVFAVMIGPGAVFIDWQERAEVEAVDRLHELMGELLKVPLMTNRQ
ncbi:hypothetical protein MIB92_03720 [Aestuariirhabdus sp. Z084]|uniref:hypothetical protein n=1 Tax=Aestuariirhabdus haliotis TaxID=2918751 RepID=UPI00201B3E07|nr:hypothetical protein [Aestuariirhabdus haliotis]MCL6414748.1 hypothetical protein [Aestuariirhabdus haliotis]MCL6418680.1 hypothetical protein [Aestuariirhabdus haliotis]